MKRLFAILLVAILATTFAMAAHNDPGTANAQFDVKVITPLVVNEAGDLTLPNIIQGQTRTWDPMVMTFTILGEATYSIDVTATTTPGTNPSGTLTLLGTGWSILPAATMTLDGTGKALVTWTCTGATADATAHGTYTFTHKVTARYTGL